VRLVGFPVGGALLNLNTGHYVHMQIFCGVVMRNARHSTRSKVRRRHHGEDLGVSGSAGPVTGSLGHGGSL
jgi:hypothetical protein